MCTALLLIALITAVLCWTVVTFTTSDINIVSENLAHHFGEISGILFFLLWAMVVFEYIDAQDGFNVITDRITTTIVMLSLQRELLADRNGRLFFAGFTIIAANAGGAWSSLGDMTSTMLWLGGQITACNMVTSLYYYR